MRTRLTAAIGTAVTAVTVGVGLLAGGIDHAHADTSPPTQTTMSVVGHATDTGSTRVIDVSKYSDAAFVSPTGRIACHLSSDNGPDSVAECAFPDGPVNSTLPPAGTTCQDQALTGVGVLTSRPALWTCSTDVYLFPLWQRGNASVAWARDHSMPTATWISEGRRIGRAAELPYGTTLVSTSVACTMHTTGVVCESLRTHQGFMLNSHHVTPIGTRSISRP